MEREGVREVKKAAKKESMTEWVDDEHYLHLDDVRSSLMLIYWFATALLLYTFSTVYHLAG